MLVRGLALLTALCAASTAFAQADDPLPLPAELEPNYHFWLRIYTEIDSQGGLIHDSENMAVVYEVARFPEGLSYRTRERRVDKIKKRYSAALQRLGKGKRSDLSAEEARVLSRWPEGVSNETLSRAAQRVRFQLGQADRFREGIARSGNWAEYIERVLQQYGVPRELVALPHVESSFSPRAYSRVGAAGLWQFTRSTGRLYMRVDHVVDERMDPYAAADGAARLLRDNFRRLESWPLAITAYNHGVAGMARAVKKLATRDIGRIAHNYDGRTFGFASRNFYTEFLAASEIAQNVERYFGFVQPDPPLEYETLVTDAFYSAATLERVLGVAPEVLREHNLALRASVWNGAKLVPRGYTLRIPVGVRAQPLDGLLASIPASERLARQHRDRFHKVRRGESLSRIARRYDTTQSELVALNNLRSRHRIRAGQVLRLPDDGQPRTVVARRAPPADGAYRVERGDNLWVISQRFGVSEDDLASWNSLRNRNRLAVGQALHVSQPPSAAATLVASAPSAATDAATIRPEARAVAEPAAREPARLEPALSPAPAQPLPEPAPSDVAAVVMSAVPALRVPEPVVSDAPAAAATVASALPPPSVAAGAPVPDPSDYEVHASQRVTVQPEETLGHYAEWLEVSASRLRALNRMRYGAPLAIGRQKKLDFSRVSPQVFEQRRLAYHREVQEEFFDAWVVSGTLSHSLGRGESLWYLAHEKYELPIWLLRQYNPDLDFGDLHAGSLMVIPTIEPRPAS